MSQSHKPSGGIPGQGFSLRTIYDYVMTTPGNTNPNVLISLLGELGKGSSIGKSVANALLVPIMNANGTLISPSTYNELATASNEGTTILFSFNNQFGIAVKDSSGNSFSAALLKTTITFNSDNTIVATTVESNPPA